MDIGLNAEQVANIVGHDINLLIYDELDKIKKIEEIFINDCCLLMYRVKNNFGHWVCLRKNKNIINFFDSYGFFIDDEIKYIGIKYSPKLSKLLYEYINRGGIVEYNYIKLQKRKNGINTCGRWCGLFMRLKNIPIDEFGLTFLKYKKYNLDYLITEITNKYID